MYRCYFLLCLLLLLLGCKDFFPAALPELPHYRHAIFDRSQIRVQRDIVYSTVDYTNSIRIWEEEWELSPHFSRLLAPTVTRSLGLDVYGAPDDTLRAGVLLFHGGAFLPGTGSKSDRAIVQLAYALAQRGYRVMSIDYRSMNALAPSFYKGGYVAAQDGKAALHFLVNHSERFRIHPEALFVGGISAGAITALHTAYLDEGEPILDRSDKLDRIFGCLTCTAEELERPYQLQGVINISGGLFDLDVLENNEIPALHFHGARDDLIPPGCAVPLSGAGRGYNRFCDWLGRLCRDRPAVRRELTEARLIPICGSGAIHTALENHGTPSDYHYLPNEDHYFLTADNGTPTTQGREAVRAITDFVYDRLENE